MNIHIPVEKILIDFLKLLKIRVSGRYVEKLILLHPDYPSILSISDVLQRLGVNHAFHRIEKSSLLDLTFPFVLVLDKGKSEMMLVRNEFELEQNKNRLERWSGIVLQAQGGTRLNDRSNNELYAKEKEQRNLSILLVAMALAALITVVYALSPIHSFILFSAVGGIVIGYALVAKELGIDSAIADSLCNRAENSNCNKVLESNIKILGIKPSEAVSAFFLFEISGLLLAQLAPTLQSTLFVILTALTVLTVPIVAFSIYYQAYVAKSWCRLCLIVDGLLIFQALILVGAFVSGETPSRLMPEPVPTISFVVLLTAALALVKYLKSIAHSSQLLGRIGKGGHDVKYSPYVFAHLLRQQKKVESRPFEHEVQLGNPSAPIKIIVASYLYCDPCKKKHDTIHDLISSYPDTISVVIRFVMNENDVVNVQSASAVLSYWLKNIRGRENETEQTWKLIHDWYQIWDLDKFLIKYPLDPENYEEAKRIGLQHIRWTKDIQYTPTFFVNGYQLPREYSIDDMMSMAPAVGSFIAEKSETPELQLN
jgi:uncharacterized membrane protein